MLRQLAGLGVLAGACLSSSAAYADPDDKGPFELAPMLGYSWVNLTGFSEDQFLAAAPTAESLGENPNVDVNAQLNDMTDAAKVPVDGHGPSAGLAAQLRFWVFVLGGHYAYTHTSDFGLHGVGGHLGMRIGDDVALYGQGKLGLAFVSGLPDELNTQGFTIGVGGGLDIRPNDSISFGLGLDGDVLLMASTRQISAGAEALGGGVDADTASEIDGSGIGFLIRPQLHLTWHL